ncbi:hypothetical protein [Nocardia farcinica]|uniref:Head-to-tail stopper n=1 Tax=Nocardia farcinica (strain IFM 10152) TaxID=247156 RepID=Q5YSS2_NOCFA|nr:hypothetical protein [Nocardia farcinica]BAD58769.1 hypothetical protein NFA_39210 [Nocardia farcinica IFM 10152]
MVNYRHPAYPGGTILTVLRGAAHNWEGDPASPAVDEHQIGPCDLKWSTDSEDNSKGEQLMLSARVTAPHGADVLASDRIRLPDGREFVIDGQVRETPNPFTGWSTGVRFTIAKDGSSGVRRQ